MLVVGFHAGGEKPDADMRGLAFRGSAAAAAARLRAQERQKTRIEQSRLALA